jgi:hypothetical protein
MIMNDRTVKVPQLLNSHGFSSITLKVGNLHAVKVTFITV